MKTGVSLRHAGTKDLGTPYREDSALTQDVLSAGVKVLWTTCVFTPSE